MRCRNCDDRPWVELVHLPFPDAHERLRRALALVLRVAARAEEVASNQGQGVDGEAQDTDEGDRG